MNLEILFNSINISFIIIKFHNGSYICISDPRVNDGRNLCQERKDIKPQGYKQL